MLCVKPGIHVIYGSIFVEVKKVGVDGMLYLQDVEGNFYPSVDPRCVSPLPLLNSMDTDYQNHLLVQSEKNITDDELILADFRAGVLRSYMAEQISREEAMRELGLRESSFHGLLREFDSGPLSICRKKRGCKKGTRKLSVAQEAAISESIEIGLAVPGGTQAKAYEILDAICIKNNITTPSMNSLRRRVSEISAIDLAKKQVGSRLAHLNLGLKPGAITAEFPLHVVQIDHTEADIFILNEFGKKLYRPWISLAIDVYSRVVLGFHVSLSAPSVATLGALMNCCAFDKKRALDLLGCEDVSYEFSGIPLSIVTDNAKEFHSKSFAGACARHGIERYDRAPGIPYVGGVVERVIGTFMKKLHRLPGTTFSNVVEKNKNKKITCGKFRVRQLAYWMVRSINIYHNKIHSELNKPPRAVWHEYFATHQRPAVLMDSTKFSIDFLPQTTRTVTTKGVEICYSHYCSESLQGVIGRRVMIKFNPIDLSKVWVRHEGKYLQLSCVDDMSMEYSLHDRKLRRQLERQGYRPFEIDAHLDGLALDEDMRRFAKENADKPSTPQEWAGRQELIKRGAAPDYSELAIPYLPRE